MHVYVGVASPWLNEHIRSFVKNHVPDAVFVDTFEEFPKDAESTLQFCDGWALNRNFALLNSGEGLINAYPNSDALSRKDYLARVVEYWTAKRPDSVLRSHVPLTVRLSLDYAEYVEDALAAADDLTLLNSLEQNETKPEEERDWWILKPALVDCGAGIRIFSTIDELAGHLELAEYELTDSEEDDDDGDNEEEKEEEEDEEEEDEAEADAITPLTVPGKERPGPSSSSSSSSSVEPSLSLPGLSSLDAIVTATSSLSLRENSKKPPIPATTTNGASRSGAALRPKKPTYVFKANGRIPSAQMRAFVAQQYISRVAPLDGRKWHVRAYVLSVGRLRVHVFRDMLALLAAEAYQPPWRRPSLRSSLTNTALQDEDEVVGGQAMRGFWDDAAVDGALFGGGEAAAAAAARGERWKDGVWRQVCEVTAELFRAAAHTSADKFTTVEKCFELFALDFLVDADANAWLLEANETPAFYQQGVAGPMAVKLMESVVCVVLEHFGRANLEDPRNKEARERMVQVLDETEKLGKSNISEICCDY